MFEWFIPVLPTFWSLVYLLCNKPPRTYCLKKNNSLLATAQDWAALPSIFWLKFPAFLNFLIKTSFLVESQAELWSKIRMSGAEMGTGQGSHFRGHCSLLETEKQGRKAQVSWGQESTCPSYILAFITQCPHTGLLDSLSIFSKKRNSRKH